MRGELIFLYKKGILLIVKKISIVSILLTASLLTSCGAAKTSDDINESVIPSETTAQETTAATTAETTARQRMTTATTTAETSETTEETTETSASAAPSETVTVYSLSDDQLQDVYINEYVKVSTAFADDEYRQYNPWGAVYPVLTIDSDDAERINSEIEEMASRYPNGYTVDLHFDIIPYTDTIFTLVVHEYQENAKVVYHPYVIDTATGHQLTNSEILEMTGVDEDTFRETALGSLMDFYTDNNLLGEQVFVNGELTVSDELQAYMDEHNYSFDTILSEENISSDMPMFPDHDGNLLIAPKVLFSDGYDHVVLNLNGEFINRSGFPGGDYVPFEGIHVGFDWIAMTIYTEEYIDGEDESVKLYWDGERFI